MTHRSRTALGLSLGLYVLPLAGLWVATLLSGFYQSHSDAIRIASAISTAYDRSVRVLFADILIPLVTAFSVHELPRQRDYSPSLLLGFLAVACASGFILYGVASGLEDRLAEYGQAIPAVFSNASLLYGRETLTYLAMAGGFLAADRVRRVTGGP
jgi:hypothetical protein